MEKRENNQNSAKLLSKHNKIVKKYFKTNKLVFTWFLLDQIIFFSTIILFILNLILKTQNRLISYVVVGESMYLLLKFTYTNWFSKNKYFQSIFVFEETLKLDSHKFNAQRCIAFIPIWFWIYIIIANFITVVFINYELSNVLNGKPLLTAILESMLNVLLLPSFLNSFQKLTQANQDIESNYKNLVKTQYFSNESLFKDAKFSEHYLNVVFKKNNLTSKNGLFIFTNKKDLKEKEIQEIEKTNKKILQIYSDIWDNYYELLEVSSTLEFSKKRIRNLFWVFKITFKT